MLHTPRPLRLDAPASADAWPRLQREAAAGASLALATLLLAAAGLWALDAAGPQFGMAAAAVFVLAAAVAARWLPQHLPHRSFGLANRITLLRLVLVATLAGFVADDRPADGWLLVPLATGTALLDIVDGRVARRSGLASAFGARFDMETDALLILVLSLLVWRFDKAGAWIVLAGLARYFFVVAMRWQPSLARPLPESLRRKTVCVVQIVALIVCLGPVIEPPLSTAIAAASLAALLGSFAVDIGWLIRHATDPLSKESPP